MPHWGYHFPTLVDGDGQPTRHLHWGGENAGLHFVEDMAGVPTTPPGAGAFELVLDAASVTYVWSTGIAKHRSGYEQRAELIDDPAARYQGRVLLRDDEVRAVRVRLARFAAAGLPFLLGLPWEAEPVLADSTGTTLSVPATARLDWAEPGVRVLVRHELYGSISTVIQTVGANSLEVLDTLGDVGKVGALVVPLASVLLDAQQGFDRYQPMEPVEQWNIRARNADAGWRRAGTAAGLDLDGALTGLRVEARDLGPTDGRIISIEAIGPAGGQLNESVVLGIPVTQFTYSSGVTTVADFIAKMSTSPNVRVIGTPVDLDATLELSDAQTDSLTGGSDVVYAEVGKTATLTTYRDRPVWDRSITVRGTVGDSIQTMADIIDMGGLPTAVQTASMSEWGQAIVASGPLGDRWQWAKKMLWTLGGSWGSFWLSTFRADLVVESTGVGTLTVTNGDAAGDVWAWYPGRRQDLAVTMTDRSVTYVRIATAVNNGDGTTTLSIVDEDDDPVTLAGTILGVSWLERVRLESDEVTVNFGEGTFDLAIQARTARQGDL
jgi:hypothetical protein